MPTVTKASLITSLQQWLGIDAESGDERLPTTVADQLIEWAMREYCRSRESRFGEESDTFPTIANIRDYAEPDRFVKPKRLAYFSATGAPVELRYLKKEVFDSMFPESVVFSTGGPYSISGLDTSLVLSDPTHYSLWARKILLAPVPDRIITIFRSFYAIPPALPGNGNTTTDRNQMIDQADQYVLFKAAVGAELFGIEDDRIPMWQSHVKKLEDTMDSEDARRHVTGTRSQSREPG